MFKKKVSPNDAAGAYIVLLLKTMNNTWEDDKQTIKEFCDQAEITWDEDGQEYGELELFLAVLSLEFQVLANKYPQYYSILLNAVTHHLNSMDEFGEYAYNTVTREYLPEIMQAIHENGNPFDGVLTLLLSKYKIQFDTLVAMGLMEIIASKIGTWDNILNKYTLRTSGSGSVKKSNQFYYGFGGWLYLYAIYIFFTAFNASSTILDYHNVSIMYSDLLDPYSQLYSSLWQPYFLTQLIIAVITLGFIFFIGYCGIKLLKAFKYTSIAFFGYCVLTSIIDVVFLLGLNAQYVEVLYEEPFRPLIFASFQFVSGTAYFIYSKRVNNTFTRGWGKNTRKETPSLGSEASNG